MSYVEGFFQNASADWRKRCPPVLPYVRRQLPRLELYLLHGIALVIWMTPITY
jgi:hypothetical protein